jgi:pyruvate,water dikinase
VLSADFFAPWVEGVTSTDVWRDSGLKVSSCGEAAVMVCEALKTVAALQTLIPEQQRVLDALKEHMKGWAGGLAAVRSSAPEEDGTGQSFAGVFETKLGVTADTLETAVRACFASVFDHRVFAYSGLHEPAFAAVVMEMVPSITAGVAFSANPLNCDLDELVVDSSWGLGESVVDGSIVADKFVWDKIGGKLIERVLGSKTQERILRSDGGVEVRMVEETRRTRYTLLDTQLATLSALVCRVEDTYRKPIDIEWAHNEAGDLKLLQARPITTIHPMDPKMLTKAGEPRVLYYDFNIASEATTTSPFTKMDLELFGQLTSVMMGAPGVDIFSDKPDR